MVKHAMRKLNPTHIIIHHSLTKDSKTVSWGAIRDYHMGLGWSDVGYHYGVEMARDCYEIFLGRMADIKGAHCKSMNGVALGICAVGNFDRKPPHPVLWSEVLRLTQFLMRLYGIKEKNVHGHCEIDSRKTCPGQKWDMERFRREL